MTKQLVTRKVTNALILSALAIGATLPMHTVHASTDNTSKSCGVGYVEKNGKCVAIPITDSRAARIARCIMFSQKASDTPAQALAKVKACLKTK